MPTVPADESILGFQVWRSLSPFALIATLPADATNFTDPEVSPEAKYKITAFSGFDPSEGFVGGSVQLDEVENWTADSYVMAASSEALNLPSAPPAPATSVVNTFALVAAGLLISIGLLAAGRPVLEPLVVRTAVSIVARSRGAHPFGPGAALSWTSPEPTTTVYTQAPPGFLLTTAIDALPSPAIEAAISSPATDLGQLLELWSLAGRPFPVDTARLATAVKPVSSGVGPSSKAAAAKRRTAHIRATERILVEDIEGIGPVYAARLSSIGIWTVGTLLAADPEVIASRLGMGTDTVRRWHSMAELMLLPGVGPQFAEQLVRCGVLSIAGLAAMDPADVLDIIVQADASRGVRLHGASVGLKTVTKWQLSAKQFLRET